MHEGEAPCSRVVLLVTEDEAAREREEELERKRNKSRLKEADFLMLHEQNPYPEATLRHHGTLKYLRRTYGRYGAASNIDPAICWPVKVNVCIKLVPYCMDLRLCRPNWRTRWSTRE